MNQLLDNIKNRQFKRLHRVFWLRKRMYIKDIIVFGSSKVYIGITTVEAKQMELFTRQLIKYSR